jgi:hypothetical protein
VKSIHREAGCLHIAFEPHEVEFLLGLSDKIPRALEEASNLRLFPACADDEAMDRELCGWLHPELKAARLDRLAFFRQELQRAFKCDGVARLDDEALDRWLRILNDLRLIFAGELNIDSDDWPRGLTEEQRNASAVRIYRYLSGLQGALLEEGFGLAQPDVPPE